MARTKTRRFVTLRQRKLLKELPYSKTISEAGLKAGYKKTSLNGLYRGRIRKYIKEFLDTPDITPEQIINIFKMLINHALKQGDITNANRSSENLAKIKAMFIDKPEVNINVYTQQENDEYIKTKNRLLNVTT